jgi:hypothetical protein
MIGGGSSHPALRHVTVGVYITGHANHEIYRANRRDGMAVRDNRKVEVNLISGAIILQENPEGFEMSWKYILPRYLGPNKDEEIDVAVG